MIADERTDVQLQMTGGWCFGEWSDQWNDSLIIFATDCHMFA